MMRLGSKTLITWALLGGAIHAGPIGTYYLTDNVNSTSGNSLDAIQGNNYFQNATIGSHEEGPIAVFGNLGVVRTTGVDQGHIGGEYGGVPNLSITPTGSIYTNPGLGTGVYDGTTDGGNNYTVGFNDGTVYVADTTWGSLTPLFTTGNYGDLGITYDAANNSLWIQNFIDGTITDYTLGGTPIVSFGTPEVTSGAFSALAMDVDHTLWFQNYDTGNIFHYTTTGTFLNSENYSGLYEAFGGEIASSLGANAVPEPGTLTLIGLGAIGLVSGAVRRRSSRQNVA